MTDEGMEQGVDNIEQMDDNAPMSEPDTGAAADDAAEDTPAKTGTDAAYEEVIAAKDELIGVYEKQVASLKRQITELIRNGAVITDGNAQSGTDAPDPNLIRKQNYDAFADLGKEIGR